MKTAMARRAENNQVVIGMVRVAARAPAPIFMVNVELSTKLLYRLLIGKAAGLALSSHPGHKLIPAAAEVLPLIRQVSIPHRPG
jgi:hypothetical protein